MYKVLDLFAGAGGMSLGFDLTNKYEVKLAVENNKAAQQTYKHNNPKVEIIDDILAIESFEELKKMHGNFDVVIGGPPCQGFSNANRQRNSLINQNNNLVKKFIEVIEELEPLAFVMENVKMITSKTHVFFKTEFDKGDEVFRSTRVSEKEIILLKGKFAFGNVSNTDNTFKDFSKLLVDQLLFSRVESLYKYSLTPSVNPVRLENSKNNFIKIYSKFKRDENEISSKIEKALNYLYAYTHGDKEFSLIREEVEQFISHQKLFININELSRNKIVVNKIVESEDGIKVLVDSIRVIDYVKEKFKDSYDIEDGVLNALWFGAPQSRERYIAVGLKKGLNRKPNTELLPSRSFFENYRTVKEAIGDLESIPPSFDIDEPSIKINKIPTYNSPLIQTLRNSNELYNHVVTNTRPVALERFAILKQGQNFHDLNEIMVNNTYSKPERTQNSIYKRLEYDKPSGTVTNVRKSMWIHPNKNRAVSIREAARLQTFPDNYRFHGKKDEQYQQVGNAVPPIMAYAISENLLKVLKESKNKVL